MSPTRAPQRPPVTYTCGGCDHRWAGVSRAHCAACHRTFSGVTTFDEHRKGNRGCVNPAQIDGLLFRDGLWRSAKEFTAADDLFG